MAATRYDNRFPRGLERSIDRHCWLVARLPETIEERGQLDKRRGVCGWPVGCTIGAVHVVAIRVLLPVLVPIKCLNLEAEQVLHQEKLCRYV